MSGESQPFDPQRSCFGKTRYPTEETANAVAAKCFAERGTWLRVYRCDVPACAGGYHLTHHRALPPPKAGWRPPAKSKRQEAFERREQRRRRRSR